MTSLDVFIEGETVDLAIPTRDYALNSKWYAIFNNKIITRYLDQGAFPNTIENQVKFWENSQHDRLLLIIQSKDGDQVGIISLSSIDYKSRSAELAIVIDQFANIRMSPIFSLEAVCIITQHGFEALGVRRIQAGQHTNLSGWQNRMELAGYRIEGIHKDKFVKGNEISDSVTIAITYDSYRYLTSKRNGNLWDARDSMETRLLKLPTKTLKKSLTKFMEDTAAIYYESIYDL